MSDTIKVRVIGYTSTGKTYHFGPPCHEEQYNIDNENMDSCRGILYLTALSPQDNPLGKLVQNLGRLFSRSVYYDIVMDESRGAPPNKMTISIIPIKYKIRAAPYDIEIKYYDYPGQDHLLAYILLSNMIVALEEAGENITKYKKNIGDLIENFNRLADYNPINDREYKKLEGILENLKNNILINGNKLNPLLQEIISSNASYIKNAIIYKIYKIGKFNPIYRDYTNILNENAIIKIYIRSFEKLFKNIDSFKHWGDHLRSASSVIARLIFMLASYFYKEIIKYICENLRDVAEFNVKDDYSYCILKDYMNKKQENWMEKKPRWARLFAIFDALSYIFLEISNLIQENPNKNIVIKQSIEGTDTIYKDTGNTIILSINKLLDNYMQTENYRIYSEYGGETNVRSVLRAIDAPLIVIARLTVSVLFTILAILSAIIESDVLFFTVPANTKKFLLEHLGPKHGLYPNRQKAEQRYKEIIDKALKPIVGGFAQDIGYIGVNLINYCKIIFNYNDEDRCRRDEKCSYACVELLKSSIVAISIFNYYILKLIKDLRQDNMPVVVVIATMLDTIKYPNRENLSEEEKKQRDAMMRKAVLCSMAKLTNYIVRMGGGNIQNFQKLENVIKSCWKGTMVTGPWLFRFIPPFLPSIHMHAGAMEKPVIIITPGGAIIVNREGCINGTFAVVASTALFSAVEPGLRELVVNLERSLYCNYTNYEEEGCG